MSVAPKLQHSARASEDGHIVDIFQPVAADNPHELCYDSELDGKRIHNVLRDVVFIDGKRLDKTRCEDIVGAKVHEEVHPGFRVRSSHVEAVPCLPFPSAPQVLNSFKPIRRRQVRDSPPLA